MLKRLLLVGALIFPAAQGHAAQCGPDANNVFYDCWREGFINFSYEDLTPSERNTVAAIAERMEARINAEAELAIKRATAAEKQEQARIAQCTIPMLQIGCPAKQVSR